MEGKIQTLHPQGKSGVNISKEKYDVMKETITSLLRKKPLTHIELTNAVIAALKGRFTGSIPWYVESVKLDLEARKIVERVEGNGKTLTTYRLR